MRNICYNKQIMTNIDIPYYCTDDLYAVIIMSICIFCIMGIKMYKIKQENKKLQELCTNMKKYSILNSSDEKFNYFGVDVIKISLSDKLTKFYGQLSDAIFELKLKSSENLGYVLPYIRITENRYLDNKEYEIFIRDKLCGKYVVKDKKNAVEEIINNIESISVDKVEKIFLDKHVEKLLENIANKRVSSRLKNVLGLDTLREIFIGLLKSSISIKDIDHIAECLDLYSRQTTSVDQILILLKPDLK